MPLHCRMGHSSPTYSDVKKDSFHISGTDLGLLWILPPTSDESTAKHRRTNMGFEVKELWA